MSVSSMFAWQTSRWRLWSGQLASFANFSRAWCAIIYVCVTDILLWYIECCDGLVTVVDVKLMAEGILLGCQLKVRYMGNVKVAAVSLIVGLDIICPTNRIGDCSGRLWYGDLDA